MVGFVTFRSNRFIVLNDGSTLKNLQIIVMESNFSIRIIDKELLKKITIGIALQIKGILIKRTGNKQVKQVISKIIQIYNKVSVSDINIQPNNNNNNNKTILQRNFHKLENQLSFCAHEYFYYQGFFYLHTPIITSLRY